MWDGAWVLETETSPDRRCCCAVRASELPAAKLRLCKMVTFMSEAVC